MKSNYVKLSTKWNLCLLLFFATAISAFGQNNRVDKARALYDSMRVYQLESPETVLATVILETGWIECTDCSLKMNNLFGFRSSNDYISFKNISECLAYMKKWQNSYYRPWKAKHPDGTYYQFLTFVKYAQDMPRYVRNVKSLECWLKQNVAVVIPEVATIQYDPSWRRYYR